MNADYYSRQVNGNSDGTPIFATDHDKANEDFVAGLIERVWHCEVRPFGNLCPVDFYALRDGRMVAVLELKSRTVASTRYDSVFLNVRKWLSLVIAGVGLGCPAIFVVNFTDGLKYIRVDEIDARSIRIGGCAKIVKSMTDIEPVILVPIQQMRSINDPDDEEVKT